MNTLIDSATAAIPRIIFLIILLLVGWLVAKVVRWSLSKALKAIKLQGMMDKMDLTPIMVRMGITDIAKTAGTIGYWFVMLLVLITAAESIEMDTISSGLAALMAFLPKIFAALVILVLGMLMSNLIKKIVFTATDSIGLSGAQVISNVVYYILLIFVLITAIDQTGVDTTLIRNNVTLIFAAILLAFAASYAFASRDIMTNMLSSFYSRDRYREGMNLKIGDVEGHVVAVDNLSITIKTTDKKVVIPIKKLLAEQIEILDSQSRITD